MLKTKVFYYTEFYHRDRLEDPVLGGRMILKCVLKKGTVRVWIGFV